jgi:hypothetical protein
MQKLMIWVKGNMQEVPENLQDTLSQVRPGPDGKDGDLFNCTVTVSSLCTTFSQSLS